MLLLEEGLLVQCLVLKINLFYQVAMASGFSSRSDEILNNFWISDPTVAVERNASLKNQSSLEENCENIIFAGTQADRKEKHKKKETKKIKNKKNQEINLHHKTRIWWLTSTLVYSAPDVLQISIVTIFR